MVQRHSLIIQQDEVRWSCTPHLAREKNNYPPLIIKNQFINTQTTKGFIWFLFRFLFRFLFPFLFGFNTGFRQHMVSEISSLLQLFLQ